MKGVNSDTAYDYIREKILNGEFRPGKTLTTSQLAVEIGVSRTPVRDALRQLESDGLVLIRPHFGASVRLVTFQEFRDLCGMRLALESYAASFAAVNRTEEELREMNVSMEAMRAITVQIRDRGMNDDLLNQLVPVDIRFHIQILTAARNEMIRKHIMKLHLLNRLIGGKATGMLRPVGEESRVNYLRVMEEHEEIFRQISQRSAEGAMQAMHRHVQGLIDKQISLRARAEMESNPKPLTADEMIYTT